MQDYFVNYENDGGIKMFCSNCGGNVDDNAKFCPVCGTQVNSADSNQAQPADPYAQVNQAQPADSFAPVEEAQPADPFAPGNEAQPADPFAPENETQPGNPFAPVGDMQSANPFGNPTQQQPVDAFGNPVQSQPVDAFGNPVQPQQGEQWNPLMQPTQKSKKPLIIGIVCGAIALVLSIVIILLFACGGDDSDKDEKATTKSEKNTTAEKETTEEETTEEETTDSAVSGDIDEIAMEMLEKYLDAIIAEDLETFKGLFVEEIFADRYDYVFDGSWDDSEILSFLSPVDSDFGVMTDYEILELEYSYDIDADYENDEYGLTGDKALVKQYIYEGLITIRSAEREATFEFDFDVYEGIDKFYVEEMYIWDSTFVDYDYTYTGSDERDEFRYWNDDDYYNEYNGGNTSGDEDETTDVSGEGYYDEEMYEMLKSYVVADGGVSSLDELVKNATKGFVEMDYETSKNLTAPIRSGMYDMLIDYGYTSEDAAIDFFDSMEIYEPVTFKNVTYEEEDFFATVSIEDYNIMLDEMQLDGQDATEGKNAEGTITYEIDGSESQVGFTISAVLINGKWYILDMFLDAPIGE